VANLSLSFLKLIIFGKPAMVLRYAPTNQSKVEAIISIFNLLLRSIKNTHNAHTHVCGIVAISGHTIVTIRITY
jgi:hypothetical protein